MIEERRFGDATAMSAVCDRCGQGWVPGGAGSANGLLPGPAWHSLGHAADGNGPREDAEIRLRERMADANWAVIEGRQETLLCPGCKENA